MSSTVLMLPAFALGFVNPLLLWGLAAASVPILLHLLNRRRFREERWAAMQFLLAAIKKNQRRIRLEHWLLLLIRTLLVLALVFGLARPFLESIGVGPLLAGVRTHRVVVVDGSMSMLHTTAERSRFDQAVQYAKAYVEGARSGDVVSLVLLADPPEVVIGTPSPNLEEVQEELDQLKPTHGTSDLLGTLGRVREVLNASELPQKEVLILSDSQAVTWNSSNDSDEALNLELQRLERERANIVLIEFAESNRENTAVVDLELDAPAVVQAGLPTLITARMTLFGNSPTRSTQARLVVDGRLGPEREVQLQAGIETPIAFTYQFEEEGDHVVEVQLTEDRLSIDDSRRLVVPVREKLEILLVDGDFRTEPFESETDYLAQALAPSSGTDQSPSPFEVRVVTDSQLGRESLETVDALFLCNVAQLNPRELRQVDRFLRQGGGVVVFSGDRIDLDGYQDLVQRSLGLEEGLGPVDVGFLPAAYGPVLRIDDPNDLESINSAPGFNPLDFRHPIVADYEGTSELVQLGLTDVRSWSSHQLLLPDDSDAQTALAYTDGRPAIVTSERHRGVVVQIATSADSSWTTWPLLPSYPPVMQAIALFAASGRAEERNRNVGQPIDFRIDSSSIKSAIVERPDGVERPGALRPETDGVLVTYEETDRSGIYRARTDLPSQPEVWFAVNPVPIEGDLTRSDPSSLKSRFSNWAITSWDGGPTGDVTAASVGRRGEFHRILLFAVLILLVLESILAWWIGRRR